VVSAHGLFGFADKFQHLLAQLGKTQIALVTQLLGLIKKIRNLLG
jgi:hypothetical protein